jgi:RNA polymerase sigma factor (sigma-70 family)
LLILSGLSATLAPILTFLTTISSNGNSADPTDQELVTAYRRSGDLRILAQLYQRYLDLLFGVCLKYLEDRELAKDAVMEIFGELTTKLIRHEVSNFKSWLYTLAKNHCLMQLRSSSRIKVRPFDPGLVQTAEEWHHNDILEKEARLDRLSDCIDTLSSDQKIVVNLFYLENKCYKEIETITGYDWNKVRSLIQNGRRNLRICMQQHEEEPSLKPPPLTGIRKAGPEGKDPAPAI